METMNDAGKLSPEELRMERWRIHDANQTRIRDLSRWTGLLEAFRIVLRNKRRPSPHPSDVTIVHISYRRPSYEERQADKAALNRAFRELSGDYRTDEELNRCRLDADF